MASTTSSASPLNLLAELTYPEYRHRHVFTARLRFIIFVSFVFLYALAISQGIPVSHPAIVALVTMSALTTFCYYNILNGQWMIPSIILEIIADLVTITLLIDLFGGITTSYFLLYFGYCLSAGLFFNYRVAALLAVLTQLAYLFLYWSALHGILPWHDPQAFAQVTAVHHGAWSHPLWVHPLMLAMLQGFAVYAVKMAQDFHLLRERSLEARNRELVALQRIGGMIRTTASLPEVADRVIAGLVEGLDFSGCLLMLADRKQQRLVCHPQRELPYAAEAEAILGIKLNELYLPFDTGNEAFRKVQKRQVVFRRDLADLMTGMQPPIPEDRIRHLQQRLGIRKTVAIPLVAEGELLGTLVGFFTESFVGERAIAELETFADQAALVLRVTLLIDQLKEANRELLEANRVKGEFLATMSHELRTPLTAIIGFSELLVEGAMGTLTDEQQESLREILNNGSNLLELINNILDLARMESGRFALNVTRFDLRDLLERIYRSVSPLLSRKQQQFFLVIPKSLPAIEADERRVQQVILNLLGNAIKFTPEGGTIEVTAVAFNQLGALRDIQWAANLHDPAPFQQGGIHLQVRDTGIGIPTTHLRAIFEMFQQIDSSVTRKYEGTGLGLALVRQLVEMHHGTIWAESDDGRGATFHTLLPLAQPDVATEPPEPQPAATTPSIPTIRVPV